MILSNQRAVFNRPDLGYNLNNKQKCVNNFFKKYAEVRTSTCYCYDKIGHKSYECNLWKYHKVSSLEGKVKQVQVPKGTKVKSLGLSKKSQIPKLTQFHFTCRCVLRPRTQGGGTQIVATQVTCWVIRNNLSAQSLWMKVKW